MKTCPRCGGVDARRHVCAPEDLRARGQERDARAVADEPLVRDLWVASRVAPLAGSPWVGEGWRLLDVAKDRGSLLFAAWVALCESSKMEDLLRVERAHAVDHGTALGIDAPIEFQVASIPGLGRVGFRWVRTDTREVVTEIPGCE